MSYAASGVKVSSAFAKILSTPPISVFDQFPRQAFSSLCAAQDDRKHRRKESMPFLSVFVADLLDADDRRPVTSGPNHLFNTRLCLGTCLKTDSEPAFLTPAARFEISAHANADMCFWNLRCGNREDADFAFVVCVWVGISAKGYLEGRTWGAVSVDLQTSQSH